MPPEKATDRELLGYLAAVVGLATVTISLLGFFFVSRIPSFTLAFAEDPLTATQDDPIAIVLILTIGLTTVLLLGLVVGFGARYGLADPPEASRDR